MGKVKVGIVSVILFTFLSSSAQAGFYDWMRSARIGQNRFLAAGTLDANDHLYLSQVYNKSGIMEPTIEDSDPIIEITEEVSGFSVTKFLSVRATGYSSTPDQTDDSPFTTASGTNVRDGIIAANFHIDGRRVPFGTKIRIPDIYGNKIFVVEDRMNARYTNNIDIWFPERSSAQRFGSRTVKIEIIHEEVINS